MSEAVVPTREEDTRLAPGLQVLLAWLAVSFMLVRWWSVGILPATDADDLLKAHEIRFLLDTGNIFDRTLPGILQPAPFTSHWSWLTDAPYAALALLMTPIFGKEIALQISFLTIPLVLLAVALLLLRNIVYALGFARPGVVFAVAVFAGYATFAEFQPGRIDYHNLQIVCILAVIWLTLLPDTKHAAASGVLMALTLAIGLEFAVFLALVAAIHGFEFIRGKPGADGRIQLFGFGLACSATILFFATVAPGEYANALPDRYSLPQALALAAAGMSFFLAPLLCNGAHPWRKFSLLAVCAVLCAGAIAWLFPYALGGPYSGLSDYARDHWLGNIGQERSLFAHPGFVLSKSMITPACYFVGAMALGVAAGLNGWRDRAWVIIGLFALLAVLHSVLLFRYLRLLPLFSGLGFAFIIQCLWPNAWVKLLASHKNMGSMRFLPIVPGLMLTAILVAANFVSAAAERLEPAVLGQACALKDIETYQWAVGSRVLSPPGIGIRLVSQPGATVVAIPFHRAVEGIERAYRFFDPQTASPQAIVGEAKATHVAVCARSGPPIERFQQQMPFLVGLMQGNSPEWLTPCPQPQDARLRIYKVADAQQACPVPAIRQ